MMKKFITAFGILASSFGYAACPDLYPSKQPITPASPAIVELCNSFYVTHYDASVSRVVFTSELLQPGTAIGSQTRLSNFRADPRVKNSPASAIYEGTGFDRGHMVPAEDAATAEQMRDTFVLTNAVPQNPRFNRGEWKKLEHKIRTESMRTADPTYVLTIPVYTLPYDLLNNKIPIPSGLWKVVIRGNVEQYFFAGNAATGVVFEHKSIDWRAIIRTQSLLQRRY